MSLSTTYQIITILYNKLFYTMPFYTIGLYILGIPPIALNLFRRYMPENVFLKNMIPKFGIFNNYTVSNNRSKTISIWSYLYGIMSTIVMSLYYEDDMDVYDTHSIKDDIEKYVVESQDLTFDILSEITKMHVTVVDERVFVNDTLLSECDKDVKKTIAKESFTVQQFIQHIGFTHMLPSYFYVLLRKIGIHKFESREIFDTLQEFADNLRNVTEGHVYVDAFSKKEMNLLVVRDDEIDFVIQMLEKYDIYNRVWMDLRTNGIVQENTKRVYQVYMNIVNEHLTTRDKHLLAAECNKNTTEVYYAIVNVLFLITWFHSKTHFITVYNKIHIANSLINQVNYSTHFYEKHYSNNKMLSKIRESIEKVEKGQSRYVINVHKM